jgi:N-acetylglucosamine-6-sulfatase
VGDFVRHSITALVVSLLLLGAGIPHAPVAEAIEPGASEGTAPATATGTTRDRPPNILLIATDDQHVDDLDYMPRTRRLIGDQGVTFTDAISTDPLCCPARAVLATGLLNHNNGVTANSGRFGGYSALLESGFASQTVPTWLNDTRDGYDYESAFIGKYLNGYGHGRGAGEAYPVPEGWDYFAGGLEGTGLYNFFGGSINVLDRTAGEEEATVERADDYRTYYNTERVIERIEHAAGTPGKPHDDRPFFIWMSDLAPHGACWPKPGGGCKWGKPMWAPEDDGKFTKVPLRPRNDPSFSERVVSDKPSHIQQLSRWTPHRVTRATEFHRARLRSLQSVDRGVAKIVRRLEELGQLDNTLIIFTSDNGHLNGEHRFMGKAVPYEPSIRVPLLMRGPGIPAGTVIHKTTSLVDIPATIADAAGGTPSLERDGVAVPLDGMSLLPVANGAAGWGAIPLEAGFAAAKEPDEWWYRGLRTKRYTYVEYEQTGERELYDRRRDPYQLNNVAYRLTHKKTRRALASKLDQLRDCAGADCRSVGGGGVPLPERDVAPVHPDELASVGSARQAVTVTAATWGSTQGKLVAWRKVGRSWRMVGDPVPVRLGGKGLSRPARARHLRDRTPAGAFTPAYGIGLKPDPGAKLNYQRLDGDDQWPFDPDMPQTYNVLQPNRPLTARWSADRSLRWAQTPRRYPHAMVMRYNLPRRFHRAIGFGERVARVPADPKMGSLVIHAGPRTPKQGWVSMAPHKVRWLLRWTDPELKPIFVIGPKAYQRNKL